MNTLITVCARGGSKGIPGKNIKILNKKPLIYYSLKLADIYASENPGVQIYLSTDSDEIKQTVRACNLKTVSTEYDRPAELATDNSGKIGVLNDVRLYAERENKIIYDYILDLDVTSPLRTIQDIQTAFGLLRSNKEAINIFSVNEANRNPYFNMVEKRPNSEFIQLVKEGEFVTRQSAPKVYDMNASFYIYRRSFFENHMTSPITPKTLIYQMPHICFDLDHPLDYDFMSFLMEKDKLDFNFLQ
ncbi:acylneuraminate cytidylyltransferase family protein [Salinimicrobium tongyeongense]|uniref:Acylneuraminate cytidylyltransferase family protein n=1 Tax=Salinimicrobium tongyeongense TaxID=2809707 RepID=A0ABY6NRR1_9FLAO|nr:acylneuraminate cytidylyltransferase family protein [Salinimicrobium tongyeongense]UZH55523.1 acylneuraminate cytidylyltransferase family protein [Salinimicrobium tongyeongense]